MGVKCSPSNGEYNLNCGNYDVSTEVDSEGRDLNQNGLPIQFNTKHERIIHKLKNLRKRANMIKDGDSSKEIDW